MVTNVSGVAPSERYYHGFCELDGKLYVFGGGTTSGMMKCMLRFGFEFGFYVSYQVSSWPVLAVPVECDQMVFE